MDLFKSHFGKQNFIVLVGLATLAFGLIFIIFILKNKPNIIKVSILLLVLLVGLAFSWRMKIPQERIHILEYGLLGWLAGRDMIGKDKKTKRIILACLFSISIGLLDEGFQKILPYRIFDVRDIRINVLSGIWGVILYLLSYR
jgi:VanZ family protein